ALGPVSLAVMREISATVNGRRLLTAALGDATDERTVASMAYSFAAAGARLVKMGFAGVSSATRVESLIRSAVQAVRAGGGGEARGVGVVYVDADRTTAPTATELVALAAASGATGVLFDTINKRGPGLCELMSPRLLAEWVEEIHRAGMLATLAGR